MRIAIPQLNFHTGDITGNTEKMIQAVKKATAEKAELVVFPELAVCGAMPRDLLEREDFIDECRMAVERIALECQHIAAIVGAPNLNTADGIMYNSAYFIQNGEVTDGVHKTILSDYDIFEESRYFIAGEDNTSITCKNQKIRILFDEYEADYIHPQDHLVIFIGNVPFSTESFSYRQQVFSTLAKNHRKTILALNTVGANTSIIYDGNSLVYNAKGIPVGQLKEFEEDFQIFDSQRTDALPGISFPKISSTRQIHKALILGIRDFFRKNDFKTAVLGLSGGIDSAVVAALAVEALGADRVFGLLMPSEFSTDHSVQDALELAQNLGMHHETIPIKEIYDRFIQTLAPQFDGLPFGLAEENLQARIRGTLVMTMSNKFGHIALNTSNKSEAAVGYGTLYGDLCGSLSVIGDVYKTDVYKLAREINKDKPLIPENTITKAPSAELRPGQKDQDSLPDYRILDSILKRYIEENNSPEAIAAQGIDPEIIRNTIQMVKRNEYKRAQCPPILRISKKAFGNGRRYPF